MEVLVRGVFLDICRCLRLRVEVKFVGWYLFECLLGYY